MVCACLRCPHGILQQQKMKKMNVPITRRHALLSFGYLFVFYIPYIVLFMIMFRGVHWSKKKACYKWIYYPMYDSLSTINHWHGLDRSLSSVVFVPEVTDLNLSGETRFRRPSWTDTALYEVPFV